MASDQSVAAFSAELERLEVMLDGAVLMPPQPHAATDPVSEPGVWRALFQTSFIGPLATLKAAVALMRPDVASGQRAKIVII